VHTIRKKHAERIANLPGGVAVIKVCKIPKSFDFSTLFEETKDLQSP